MFCQNVDVVVECWCCYFLLSFNLNSSSTCLWWGVCVPGRGARGARHRKTPGGYTEKWLRGAACYSVHRVGGGSLRRQSVSDSLLGTVGCLFCSEEDTRGGKMENESKRKMKERFGLRRDIFKEFLAEFLGIFVLIVSTSLCTCHPD